MILISLGLILFTLILVLVISKLLYKPPPPPSPITPNPPLPPSSSYKKLTLPSKISALAIESGGYDIKNPTQDDLNKMQSTTTSVINSGTNLVIYYFLHINMNTQNKFNLYLNDTNIEFLGCKKYFKQLYEAGIPVILSMGGWNTNDISNLSKLLADYNTPTPTVSSKFLTYFDQFLNDYYISGIDIDYEGTFTTDIENSLIKLNSWLQNNKYHSILELVFTGNSEVYEKILHSSKPQWSLVTVQQYMGGSGWLSTEILKIFNNTNITQEKFMIGYATGDLSGSVRTPTALKAQIQTDTSQDLQKVSKFYIWKLELIQKTGETLKKWISALSV